MSTALYIVAGLVILTALGRPYEEQGIERGLTLVAGALIAIAATLA